MYPETRDDRLPVPRDAAMAALAGGWPEVAARLPPPREWAEVDASAAWFSRFHFAGRPAFDLPFHPGGFVYSPVVRVPVTPGDANCAAYARGVRRYAAMLARGEDPPPVTILFDRRSGSWCLADGGHRWAAARVSGAASLPAVFALPRSLA